MALNADGSRTTYQYDNAKHEAIATTADADGKARGKVVYRIDDSGRFASGVVFGPDEKFLYKRDDKKIPERMMRAYQVKVDGKPGPWLAGMTLDPAIVYEAWCHERGYVCFIQEIGGVPVKAGSGFSAACGQRADSCFIGAGAGGGG